MKTIDIETLLHTLSVSQSVEIIPVDQEVNDHHFTYCLIKVNNQPHTALCVKYYDSILEEFTIEQSKDLYLCFLADVDSTTVRSLLEELDDDSISNFYDGENDNDLLLWMFEKYYNTTSTVYKNSLHAKFFG